MKNFFLFLLCIITYTQALSQVPNAISYQAVAYNASNIPLSPNSSIKVRFSILENSLSGQLIYQEVHSVTTYTEGVYSANIGQGTPLNGTFASIIWGTNLKFLKVELDITGSGSNFTIIGTSQLLSVPYALYAAKSATAENSNPETSIVTLKDIAALKNFSSFDKSKPCTVFVLGYNSPSDGGGGTFIFRTKQEMKNVGPTSLPSAYYPVADDGLFIKSNTIPYDVTVDNTNLGDKGLWIRQFDGDINLKFYGESGTSGDCTASLQKAIDYASLCSGNINQRPYGYNRTQTVFIPNGDWRITQIYLKSGITLKGSSKENTTLKSIGLNNNPMIQIAPGPVLDVHVSNLRFVGEIEDPGYKANTFKTCFYIKAQPLNTKESAGGLWNSTFKDIDIIRFGGNGLQFEGGTGTTVENIKYERTNQFITCENVHIESVGQLRKSYPSFINNYHALAISGLAGQFHFTNCRFDGGEFLFGDINIGWQLAYNVTGKAVYIGPVNAESGEIATPSVINFYTCTIQAAETGFLIDGAQNVTIQGCWFENMERTVSVIGRTRPSRSINIQNNLFGRTAGSYGILPPNSGSVITYENSNVNVMNNYTNNYADALNQEETVQFIRLENQPDGQPGRNLGVNTFGNTFEEDRLRFSYGVKKDISVTAGGTSTVEIKGAKLIFINNPGSTYIIEEIVSYASAGELICIRAVGGEVKFKQTKNIWLGNMTDPLGSHTPKEFTLNDGGYVLFVKSDDNVGTYRETYNLLAYNNRQ